MLLFLDWHELFGESDCLFQGNISDCDERKGGNEDKLTFRKNS